MYLQESRTDNNGLASVFFLIASISIFDTIYRTWVPRLDNKVYLSQAPPIYLDYYLDVRSYLLTFSVERKSFGILSQRPKRRISVSLQPTEPIQVPANPKTLMSPSINCIPGSLTYRIPTSRRARQN